MARIYYGLRDFCPALPPGAVNCAPPNKAAVHCRSPKVPKSACLPSAVGADAGRPPPLLDTAVSAVRPGPKDHYETREKRESRAGSTSRLRRSGDKAAVHCRTPNVLAREGQRVAVRRAKEAEINHGWHGFHGCQQLNNQPRFLPTPPTDGGGVGSGLRWT